MKSDENRSIVVATVILWLLEFIVNISFWPAGYGFKEFAFRAGSVLIVVVVGVYYCLIMYGVLRRRPSDNILFWVTAGGMIAAGSALLVFCDVMILKLGRMIFGFGEQPIALTAYWLQAWWYLLIFLAWAGLYLTLRYEREARLRSARLAEIESVAVKAENQILRYQLNPHFFLNTLSALSSLVQARRNADAEAMILQLSRFLRRSLNTELGEFVSLGEELGAERDYLDIQRTRFADRLVVRENMAPELREAAAPPLILQPIFENAVKYGLSEPRKTLTITIDGRLEGEHVVISIHDDGPGVASPSQAGLGIGLANVKRRLQALYADEANVRWGAVKPRGFEVVLRFPFKPAKP